LKKITKFADINIYSIYAHELLGTTFKNYFFDVAIFDGKSPYDISDPFVWHKISQEIKSTPKNKLLYLAQKYSYKNTKPIQALLLQKAYNYQMLGYIMPYDEYLGNVNDNTKALIYAIMRQESYFIPSSLSHSYALGLMQLMPFVADIVAKNNGEVIDDYFEMFKPEKNIKYAIKHLSWLQKNLKNPLFIAYAYNGGYGFLKRYVKKGRFKHLAYEPYMSMELMANDETREYGKKVLANYVMYKKALAQDISMTYLFGTSFISFK
jgi:soluble lytic murein transglycosylase